MKKSFKKALAAILAVMMVLTAFPMTAFAATGEYNPNINLRFGSFAPMKGGTGGANYWTHTQLTDNMTKPNMLFAGLKGAPLDYKNGQVVLTKTKADEALTFCKSKGATAIPEDYVYKKGDIFAVTITMENVSKLWGSEFYLTYSNNIEPAALYEYMDADYNTCYGLFTPTEAEAAAADSGEVPTPLDGSCIKDKKKAGLYADWSAQSAVDLYTAGDINIGATGDTSRVNTNNHTIFVTAINQNGKNFADVSSLTDKKFANPTTGQMNASYVYSNEAVLSTFVFKITGDGPITFDMEDKDNTKHTAFGGAYYIADKTEGTDPTQYCTYALQDGCPGSAKITFMGKNDNLAAPEPDHVHDYQNPKYDGAEAKTHTFTCTNADGKCDALTKTEACTFDEGVVTKSATCKEAGVKTYTCSVCGGTYTEEIPKTSDHSYTSQVTKEATCVATGIRTYTCSVCGDTYTEEIPVNPKNHTGNNHLVGQKNASCTEAGYTGDLTCECGVVIQKGEVIPMGEHDYSVEVPGTRVASTCKTAGHVTMKCTACDATKVVELPLDPDNHTGEGTEVRGAKEAKCGVAGYTGDTYCLGCGEKIATGKVIPALEHKWVDDPSGATVAPTCSTPGSKTQKCELCGETRTVEVPATPHANHENVVEIPAVKATCVAGGKTAGTKCAACGDIIKAQQDTPIDPTNHTQLREVPEQPATIDAPGYTAGVYCDGCKTWVSGHEVIPQLEAVNITIQDDGLGSVTGDINAFGKTRYAKNTVYTVTAIPTENAEFLGWYNGDKLLTTSNTYKTYATTDITLHPVFAEIGGNKMTVTFVDMWGNTIAAFKNLTKNEYDAVINEKYPEAAPDVAGYKFVGWDMAKQDILALNHSQTVRAKYELKADTYTITVARGEVQFVAGTKDGTNIKFDTYVTVKNESATAWKMNGVIVSNGQELSFFVGSDVTIEPVFGDAAPEVPVTALVNKYVDTSDADIINFVATRSVPAGCTLIDSGFVYGKGNNVNNYKLENVNGTTVKVAYCRKGSADQFLLPYGLTSRKGTIVAVPFVTYSKDGVVNTIYAGNLEQCTYTY